MLLYTLLWVLAWFWRRYHGGCRFLRCPSGLNTVFLLHEHSESLHQTAMFWSVWGCQNGIQHEVQDSYWKKHPGEGPCFGVSLAPIVSSFTWPHLSILAEPAHQQVHIKWLLKKKNFILWWEQCPIPTTRWICSTAFSFKQNQPNQLTTPVQSPLCASSSWRNDWAQRWQIYNDSHKRYMEHAFSCTQKSEKNHEINDWNIEGQRMCP